MNWTYVAELAVVALALLLITARAERRRVWVVALLLDLPAGYLAYLWVGWNSAWRELWVALGTALAAGLAWWFIWGRRLPRVTSDSIKVWGQEEGLKPKPVDVAAMQAEISQLRADKERAEAELRRLKRQDGDGPA